MARKAIRKTDFGTIALHWLLVALLIVAVGTGLRIAIDSPYDLRWLHALDAILPQSFVWTLHIPVATALFALAFSYSIYIWKAGLFRRIQPDVARISGLTGRLRARLGAINIVLYWIFFLTVLTELVTGVLLYLGFAGYVADVHLIGMWIIISYAPAHLAVHFAIGGASQLLRVFNPGRLAPPPPPFDPYELLAAAAERGAKAAESPRAAPPADREAARSNRILRTNGAQRAAQRFPVERGRRGEVLRVHPLTVAIAAGLASVAFLMSLDQTTRDVLVIDEVLDQRKIPKIDGDVSDAIWREAKPVRVRTQQGANLDGNGGSVVEIRAVHDGAYVYFCFIWDDPTRSLKHLPLAKTASGWRLLHNGFDKEDANGFYEDKLAVLLSPTYVLIPGDRTFHAGEAPLKNKPPSPSGRGFHYTTDGSIVDVWQWRAANGGMSGWVEDSYFGPPAEPTSAQKKGIEPYKGGFAPDPGKSSSTLNFVRRGPGGYAGPILPLRLPKDLHRLSQQLGVINLSPDTGEPAGAQWWMSEDESLPYSKELDDQIPVGAVIPGVIAAGGYQGDRADIHCAAKWAAGRWSLELVRRLDTKSKYDVAIKTGAYLRVSVFDHTQTRHTRHIRPISIKVNRCRNVAECLSTGRNSSQGEGSFY